MTIDARHGKIANAVKLIIILYYGSNFYIARLVPGITGSQILVFNQKSCMD